MTESDWQGDMLRRITAEQSAGEKPERADNPPDVADTSVDPAPAAAPPGPPGQQYPPPQHYPEQQYPPPQQYPEQQYPPPPEYQQPYPPQQQQYPPQGYEQQPPPYQPGPYEQPQYPPGYQQPGYPPQPPPPEYQQAPPGQVAPYQPAPYEQYPPPYQPSPPYEQSPQYQPPPYLDGTQYQQPPPYHQQPPGQAAPQYQQAPPPQAPGQQGEWGAAPAPGPGEGDSDTVFRRFRRIASEAAFLVGASGRMQRDVDNVATIRRPIAIMRRVGVLSPVTGGGTSTVTALLSTILAAQRTDRVVAVDADPSEAELSRRLELALGAGPIEGVSLVRSEKTAEAVRTTLAEVQGQGARDVGLAVVDCPGTMFDEISTEMASTAHATVLVVPSVEHVANYAVSQLDQLTPDGQDVLLTRGIVVITVVQNVGPESVTWLLEAFRQRGLEPVVLPYDVHVAQAWPLHTDQLQPETRRAVLDLAARVVDVVTRTTG